MNIVFQISGGIGKCIAATANKESFEPELRSSLFSKYDITGNEQEFPYNDETEIFDVNEIINTLKNYLR